MAKKDKSSAPPKSVHAENGGTGIGGNVVNSTIIAGDGNTVIQQAPPPPETHDTIGFIPPAKAETYVHRGKIEEDVIAHIRKGNAGAIVGVHAPGGLGKTELAKQAAEKLKSEYEVLWVDVGKKEPRQLLSEIMGKCGVQIQPTDSDERLKNELHHVYLSRKIFLILDDVREESLNQLAEILPPSPCAALVTSRIQDIGGVKNFALDAMDWNQARQLFEAVLGEAVVAPELDTVKTLAERCKFNPLAMEIAARRIRQFEGTRKPVARYFEIAQTRFSELKMTGDARWDMDKVFDISYLDLSAEDQQKFQKLSAFHPTGFSVEAVAFLWNDDIPLARNLLSRFINLSLVKIVEMDLERYRLHDLLDEFTTPKLKASGKYNETKTALAQWLVNLFGEHYTADISTAPHVAVERDNLLHACEWARGEKQAEVLALLTTKPWNWFYNIFRDSWGQWFAWLEASLQLGIEDKQLKANVRKAMGDVQQFRAERDAALDSYNEALKLFRQVGDKLGEANVRKAMGDVQQFRAERDAALDSYNEALKLFRQVGDKLGEANVMAAKSRMSIRAGEIENAEKQLTEIIQTRRLIGDLYGEGADYGNFAIALLESGYREKAREYALKARLIFEQIKLPAIVEMMDRVISASQEE